MHGSPFLAESIDAADVAEITREDSDFAGLAAELDGGAPRSSTHSATWHGKRPATAGAPMLLGKGSGGALLSGAQKPVQGGLGELTSDDLMDAGEARPPRTSGIPAKDLVRFARNLRQTRERDKRAREEKARAETHSSPQGAHQRARKLLGMIASKRSTATAVVSGDEHASRKRTQSAGTGRLDLAPARTELAREGSGGRRQPSTGPRRLSEVATWSGESGFSDNDEDLENLVLEDKVTGPRQRPAPVRDVARVEPHAMLPMPARTAAQPKFSPQHQPQPVPQVQPQLQPQPVALQPAMPSDANGGFFPGTAPAFQGPSGPPAQWGFMFPFFPPPYGGMPAGYEGYYTGMLPEREPPTTPLRATAVDTHTPPVLPSGQGTPESGRSPPGSAEGTAGIPASTPSRVLLPQNRHVEAASRSEDQRHIGADGDAVFLRGEHVALRAKCTQLEHESSSLRKRVLELEKELDVARKRNDEHRQSAVFETDQLRRLVEEEREKIAASSDDLSTMREKAGEAARKAAVLEGEKSGIESRLASVTARATRLEEEGEQLRAENGDLKTQLHELQERLAKRETERDLLRGQLDARSEEVRRLKERLDSSSDRVEDEKSKRAALEAEAERTRRQMTLDSRTLAQYRLESDGLRKERDAAKAAKEAVERREERQREMISELRAEISRREKQIRHLISENETTSHRLVSMRSRDERLESDSQRRDWEGSPSQSKQKETAAFDRPRGQASSAEPYRFSELPHFSGQAGGISRPSPSRFSHSLEPSTDHAPPVHAQPQHERAPRHEDVSQPERVAPQRRTNQLGQAPEFTAALRRDDDIDALRNVIDYFDAKRGNDVTPPRPSPERPAQLHDSSPPAGRRAAAASLQRMQDAARGRNRPPPPASAEEAEAAAEQTSSPHLVARARAQRQAQSQVIFGGDDVGSPVPAPETTVAISRAAAPYATEQSAAVADAREVELSQALLSEQLQLTELEGEFLQLEKQPRRSVARQRRMLSLERELEDKKSHIASLKLKLRAFGV